MNVITPMLRPGARSLPAELMMSRQYRKVDWPTQRLLMGGANRMQSSGGVRGLMGLGDCSFADANPDTYQCPDGSMYSGGGSGGGTPTVVAPTDSSFNWNALSNVVLASSTSLAKILAAQNPGTYYKDPQGNVIYTQPTGNTQNLPGIYGASGGGYGAQGTINTSLGSATFGGISSSTLMMVAVVGLAFMMMSRGR